jgi:hypothetical protein
MDPGGWDEVFDDGGPVDPGWDASGGDSWLDLSGDGGIGGIDPDLGFDVPGGEDDFGDGMSEVGDDPPGLFDEVPELVAVDDQFGGDGWVGGVPGTDPDLSPFAAFDAGWCDPGFPPVLELVDPPTPVDGWPWGDPALLGSADPGAGCDPDLSRPAWLTPAPEDLAVYGGLEPSGADWAGLLGSDDPAISDLARWWAAPR